jgi:hypothetical protein
MIGRKSVSSLVLGGSPRADLLPPEVKAGVKAKAQRRLMIAVVAAALLVVVGAYVPANLAATNARESLSQETARSEALLREKSEYIIVEQLEAQVAAAKAARVVGASTEIDWEAYLASVAGTLPLDVALESVTIMSSTPITSISAPTAALQEPRVAELVFTVQSAAVPVVAEWLANLRTLDGYVDASVDNITNEGGSLKTLLTLHINEEAYSNRYTLESEGLVD